MERSKHRDKSSVSEIHVPESARLQKELEVMTSKLEQERRQSSYLDEQIEVYEFEIKDTSRVPSKLGKEVDSLQQKLNLAHTKLNNFKSHNQYLRIKIDVSRKEIQQNRKIIQDLSEQMQLYVKRSEKKHVSIERCQQAEEKNVKGILMLRSKSADARRKHSRHISNINSYLKDELESKHLAMKEMERMFTENVNKQSNAVHISRFLKNMLERWSAKLKETKNNFDSYVKRVRTLKDSFRQIELATGIEDIFEFVTTFIKGDAQQHDLVSYLSSLNTEIETLQEAYQDIRSNMQTHQTYKKSNNEMIFHKKDKIKTENKRIVKKIQDKANLLKLVEEEFCLLLPFLQYIAELTHQDKLESVEQLKERLEFTFGEMEDAIVNMKMVNSHLNKESSPVLKRMPLNILEKKVYSHKPHISEDLDIITDPILEEFKYPLPIIDFRRKAKELFYRKSM